MLADDFLLNHVARKDLSPGKPVTDIGTLAMREKGALGDFVCGFEQGKRKLLLNQAH